MIDSKYNVRRFIAEYSEKTEELLAEHFFDSFDLERFKAEFDEPDEDFPMLACYRIHPQNVSFVERYIAKPPAWDFDNKSYFVEAYLA